METGRNPDFAIHEAAREGQTSTVESLLAANPRLGSKRDDDDRLPVHWAVSHNHLDIAKLFASRQDFDPDAQASCAKPDVVATLLIPPQDASGWSPLMMAASIPDGEAMVDLLLQREADVNLKTYNGQTALHFTVSKGNVEVARELIKHGASCRIRDKRGQLPLHRAAAIGSTPLINLLLEHNSPLNTTDSAGQSALHHAISEGHGDAALVLLKAGAEADKRDVDGHLAIELAPDRKIRDFVLRSCEREGIEMS